jgi:8-oxo-dGTP pyrophosphatase MutT (NUDIX family)
LRAKGVENVAQFEAVGQELFEQAINGHGFGHVCGVHGSLLFHFSKKKRFQKNMFVRPHANYSEVFFFSVRPKLAPKNQSNKKTSMSACNDVFHITNFNDPAAVETQLQDTKKAAAQRANGLQGAKHRKRRRKDSAPADNGGALIMAHDGTFLFLQEAKYAGEWIQPGGKNNSGESSLQAARRETLEETGIDLSNIEPVGNYTWEKSHFTTYLFHLPNKPDVQPGPTVSRFQWMDLHEASTKQLHIRVTKALDMLTSETVQPMNLESMDLGYKVTNFSVDEHPVEEDDSGSGSDECEHKCHDRVCNSTD